MRKNSRKGFTIVELVIVIAVIAILAAVLIPTFSGIIDKANTSADIQLIREANMLIQAEMIDLDRSLTKEEAEKVLAENGIDISKVTNTANEFYYIAEKSCYVIWNKDDSKITYPEDVAASLKNWTPGNSAVRIGSTYYATLKDAVNGAKAGDTIIVLKDIETSEQVTISKSLTIDFGGHTYHIKDCSENGVDINKAGISVSLKNGKIKATNLQSSKRSVFVNGNGITFETDGIVFDMAQSPSADSVLSFCWNLNAVLQDTKIIIPENNSSYRAIRIDGNGPCSFENNNHLSITIRGNSKIDGVIYNVGTGNAYSKLILEGGDYSGAKIDQALNDVSHTRIWKIKTPDGKKLTGMDSFSDKDAEGYFIYSKP